MKIEIVEEDVGDQKEQASEDTGHEVNPEDRGPAGHPKDVKKTF